MNRPERRSQPRRPAPAKRVSWARPDAPKTCTGWISDVAESSVAFVTPRRDTPTVGEAIDLTLDTGRRSQRHRVAQVARTAPHDRYFNLVACRTDSEVGLPGNDA